MKKEYYPSNLSSLFYMGKRYASKEIYVEDLIKRIENKITIEEDELYWLIESRDFIFDKLIAEEEKWTLLEKVIIQLKDTFYEIVWHKGPSGRRGEADYFDENSQPTRVTPRIEFESIVYYDKPITK